MQAGDLVLRVDGRSVKDGAQLRAMIRQVDDNQRACSSTLTQVNGKILDIAVQPELLETPEGFGSSHWCHDWWCAELVLVQKNFVDGLTAGVVKTWEVSLLVLR